MKLKCPQCKKMSGVYILYGLTNSEDSELSQRVKNKEVILGGCTIREETHQCISCGHKWSDGETTSVSEEGFIFPSILVGINKQ